MSSRRVERYFAQWADITEITLVGPLAVEPLETIEPVIFVDGGAQNRVADIGLVVGDGDSYDGELDHQLDPEKDFSDLAFALGLIQQQFTTINLLGFLGGRRDHELLNLGEVFHFLRDRQQPTRVLMDQQVVAFGAGNWTFDAQGTFSLVTFEPARVTLAGRCKYPIAPQTLVHQFSSFGLSNEGDGCIVLDTDSPVFVFINNDISA